jgi:hypothetical protein
MYYNTENVHRNVGIDAPQKSQYLDKLYIVISVTHINLNILRVEKQQLTSFLFDCFSVLASSLEVQVLNHVEVSICRLSTCLQDSMVARDRIKDSKQFEHNVVRYVLDRRQSFWHCRNFYFTVLWPVYYNFLLIVMNLGKTERNSTDIAR